MSSQNVGSSSQQRVLQAFNELRAKLDAQERARSEPIAIVGVGCRLPGHANTPESFWSLLSAGRDAITPVPSERWDSDALYDPNPDAEGKICTRMGAFIADAIDGFDAQFFGITPREAANIDPQQRLLTEVTWEALEHAGIPAHSLQDSQTGIFVGSFNNDYLRMHVASSTPLDAYGLLGTLASTQAGRIAYLLGTQGPTLQLDTACSSSLVALHLACQSLRQGECDLALVGAVSLMLTPEPSMYLSHMRVLAPDGYCKTFDAQADGFVRGEGCIVVALKRLSVARANGDHILALIRGSAVNHDGRSNGLTAPNGLAQQELLRTALRSAGVRPEQIQYVEAHGTGTALGDPIELQALNAVMGVGHEEQPLLVGSVKTNIGHLEPVAGLAGLLKVILSLQHEMLPPHLHLHTPNPYIPWSDLALRVTTESVCWPRGNTPRLAGISSFGLTGTNAHVIVEEAPDDSLHEPSASTATATAIGTESPAEPDVYFLPLSARNPVALRALACAYQQFLDAEMSPALADICNTASVRRNHYEQRTAIIGASRAELQEQLATFLEHEQSEEVVGAQAKSHKLVFVFPGQGSQWIGMGRQLLVREPVFRTTIERCELAMSRYVTWSLSAVLQGEDEHTEELFARIDVIQPLIFAMQIALADLWRSWDVQPDAVIGHSMGEIAACYVAGALTLEDAVQIICQRSQLLRRISGQGSMALVDLSQAETRNILVGYETRLSIAVSNSTRSTVISGEKQALDEVLAFLKERDIFCRKIKVDVASHSPQVDVLRSDLLQALANIQPRDAATVLYSTVVGERLPGKKVDAGYWVRNVRQPVLFASTLQRMREDGYTLFVEISPHPLLTSAIEEECQQSQKDQNLHYGQDGHQDQRGQQSWKALPSLRRNEDERRVLLTSLGALYVAGYPFAWSRLYASPRRCVQLPGYPWCHEHFWLEKPVAIAPRQSSSHVWEYEFSLFSAPFLADHRVQGEVVLPGAVYLTLALSAAHTLAGSQDVLLSDIRFEQMLLLEAQQAQRLRLVVSPRQENGLPFQVLSQPCDTQSASSDHEAGCTAPAGQWTLHAQGYIQETLAQSAQISSSYSNDNDNGSSGNGVQPECAGPAAMSRIVPEDVQEQCRDELSGATFYASLQDQGLHYGPNFQCIEQLWRGDGQALARLRIPSSAPAPFDVPYNSNNNNTIYPTLLDASMQAILSLLSQAGAAPGTYVPVGVVRVIANRVASFCAGQSATTCWSYVRLQPPVGEKLCGDIILANEQGQVVLTLQGLQLTWLAATSLSPQPEALDWCYTLRWHPYELNVSEQTSQASQAAVFNAPWLILSEEQDSVGRRVQEILEARGAICIVVTPGPTFMPVSAYRYQINPQLPADWQRLLTTIASLPQERASRQLPLRGILALWNQDDLANQEQPANQDDSANEALPDDAAAVAPIHACERVLSLVQALVQMEWRDPPRLWLVTRGAQHVEGQQELVAFSQAPLWGLGRTIAYEQPRLQCTLVDLSAQPTDDELQLLGLEICTPGVEDQLALRGQRCYAARLARYQPSASAPQDADDEDEQATVLASEDLPVGLEITRPGSLEQLHLRATTRRVPGPDDVEIKVEATSLNFLDVLKTLGLYPGQEHGSPQLGVECAGRIVACGENVQGLHCGQEVIAIAPQCFRSYVTTPASFVFPKPANLRMEEAAAIPMVFLTAYYALVHLGQLAQGERILIHSAAGGTGLAAIQIARQRGAEIFATAGSEQKRAYLRSLGIAHVMDSRSLTFAQEVRAATGGEGVDLVLNALTGQAASESLALLRPFGRFLEIGKKDIYGQGQLSLAHFRKNLTYTTIDVAAMLQQRPLLVHSLLTELLQAFATGQFQPLPLQSYPLESYTDAFRCMAQARHIGKLVLSWQQREGLRVLPEHERSLQSQPAMLPIRADSTYLLTGGLGGLGMRVAAWMVEQGARHLVLVGRRPPSSETEAVLAQLRQQGATIEVALVDVADRDELAQLLKRINQQMPPLRGLMHLAARLNDSVLAHLTTESLREVMAPKITGAWHLHLLTRDLPLDFFVLFSSVASLLGSQGQGNYAAANAFLDGLAWYRQQQGLPALSINWGAWAEIGLAAAQQNRGQRLARQGLNSISPELGMQALDLLLHQTRCSTRLPAQLSVMRFNLRQWRQSTPYASRSPVFAHLLQDQVAESEAGNASQKSQQPQLRASLASAEVSERRALLESHLREQVTRILRLPAARVDSRATFKALGFDSLTAVELRNLLEQTTGLTLSATLVWKYPTIAVLAEHLAERMQLPLIAEVAASDDQQETMADGGEEALLLISADEASRLLSAELDDLPSEFLS